MECEPAVSDEVVRLALPAESVLVPKVAAPSLNVTASLSGGGPLLELTVAVKVTACPTGEGFGLELAVVVVAYLLTFSMTEPELGKKLASPP
jgi:hypothetical protein